MSFIIRSLSSRVPARFAVCGWSTGGQNAADNGAAHHPGGMISGPSGRAQTAAEHVVMAPSRIRAAAFTFDSGLNSPRDWRGASDLAGHLRRHGIDLVENLGPVGFADPHTVAADGGRTWSADRIILAVGGHAGRPRIPGADLALTYEDIPSLASFPRRVAVVGGADTGCQIASIFDDLGATVSLFEAGPVLIPAADASVSAELSRAFRAQDMIVHTNTLVEALGPDSGAIRVDYRSGPVSTHLIADAVFFAAGDVNGRSMIVQSARMEGRIAATNAILGATSQATYDVAPSGSFTDPEYGRVGLTEAEAEAAQQHDVIVGIARYDDLLRPVADGRPDGFCKLIADRRTHTILGAHVLGEYSAETVRTVAACMAAGLTVKQVAELQLAFPTFTEAVCMAAQKICRTLGIGRFPQVWSYLGPED
jgi:pyruvate/2-oxoglutarate dehydrogenase complex dihydrolipoamide dehydrogenase (E3) component